MADTDLMLDITTEVARGIFDAVFSALSDLNKEDKPMQPKRKYREFKVGDTVRVRSWDDMASEFGLIYPNVIATESVFLQEMRKMCGSRYAVKAVKPNLIIEPIFGSTQEQNGFGITPDMLTLITAAPDRKRMTQGDIERELGYEIDIIEVED